MRAQARTSTRALALVLLMLASTQLLLLTSQDYMPKELRPEPQRFDIDNSEVAIVDLGFDHACVIGTVNQMKCWGEGSYGKTGHENTEDYGDGEKEMGQYLMFTDVGSNLTFTDVGAGYLHTCALLSDASVKCWGRNDLLGSASGEYGTGARGDGILEMGESIPPVYAFGPGSSSSEWSAVSISVGYSHSCAIVNDTTQDGLRCWGENEDGQLGLESTDTIGDGASESMTVDLPDRGGIGLSQVSAGQSHTCVLWVDGEMACWGSNGHGQLGIGNTATIGDEPGEMGENLALVDLPTGRTATYIETGEHMTCAILNEHSEGNLVCWGWGDDGRLGNEGTGSIGDSSGDMGDDLEMVDLGTGMTVESIGVGYGSSCAILDDGDSGTPETMKCWGQGDDGALGYESALTRGDGQNEMGDFLPVVDLGTGVHATYVDVGDSFACALLNVSMLKCWGTGLDGRTGLGITGATGDTAGDMGDGLPYVELYLPEETLDQPCDLPAEGSPLEQETLDSTSSYVGNKTATAMTPGSCGVVAYIDETNNIVRFGVFEKGKWATENVVEVPTGGGGGRAVDVSVAIDSSGIPHIATVVAFSGGSSYSASYLTKVDGDWASKGIGLSSQTPIAVAIEIDGDGNLYFIFQGYQNSMGSMLGKVIAMTCSAAQYESTQCVGDDWSAVPNDYFVAPASLSNSLDTDVARDGTIQVAYVSNESCDTASCSDEPGYVMVVELDSTGFGTPANTSGLAYVPGQWDNWAVAGNSSLALEIAPDDSIHISYMGASDGLHYTSCSSSCGSPSSWNSEDVTDSVDVSETGVIDIAIGADLSTLILAGTADGTFALHKSDGSWEKTEIEGEGGADWVGVELSDQGKMWAYTFHPGNSAPMTVFKQEGLATAGLLGDIDGDGWSRLDEIRCGTDFANSSSTPTDSDGDGECDIHDDREDSSISGESSALSMGEGFGCAVLSNHSVACWGGNSEGQLGNSGAGASSSHAVLVDIPSGFQAGAVDAGSGHACATGLDGTLVCWGRNSAGQLGRGTTSAFEEPGYVTLPSGVSVSEFAVGEDHNCMKGTDLNLYCWGEGDDQRLGAVANVLANSSISDDFSDNDLGWTGSDSQFYYHGSYLYRSHVHGWRLNSIQSDPVFTVRPGAEIIFNMRAARWGNDGYTSEWLKIYAGDTLIGQVNSNSSYEGTSWSPWYETSVSVPDSYQTETDVPLKFEVWGSRVYLQIDDLTVPTYGSGGVLDKATPEKLSWSQASAVTQLALGSTHTCALVSGGQTYCWGGNGGAYDNTLGNTSFRGENTFEPQRVDLSASSSLVSSNWTGGTVRAIFAGDGVSCSLMQNGESLCWGASNVTSYVDPVVDTVASTGDVGRSPYLIENGSGNWVIAYYDNGGLSYASYNGSAWVATEACNASECDGIGASMAVSSDGEVHMVQYNSSDSALVHTRNTGSSWDTQVLAGTGDLSASYPGSSLSFAGEAMHVTHVNATRGAIDHLVQHPAGTAKHLADGDGHSVGMYTSLAVDSNGNQHVSYYNSSSSGLSYAMYDGISWTTEDVDTTGTAGYYTSIALDGSDRPHISYVETESDLLRYAHYDGTGWQATTLDDLVHNVHDTSIAIDASGNPQIAYSVYNQSGASETAIRLASYNGSSWSISTIETWESTLGFYSLDLKLNNSGTPYLVYANWSDDGLYLASKSSETWSTTKIRDDAGFYHTSFSGRRGASLAIDQSDGLHVAFFDRSGWDLGYLHCASSCGSSSSWAATLDIDTSSSYIGWSNSIAVNESGSPHIAYYDHNGGDLEYAHCSSSCSSSSSWAKTTIDSTNSVGEYPDLAIDGHGQIHVSYYDATNADLKTAVLHDGVARASAVGGVGSHHYQLGSAWDSAGSLHVSYYNGSDSAGRLQYAVRSGGSWAVTVVDESSAMVGAYSSLALDGSGNPHISYLDSANGNLRHAQYDGSTWSISTVDSSGDVGGYTAIAIDDNDRPRISYHDSSASSLMLAVWDGSSWILTTQGSDSGGQGSQIAVDVSGGSRIAYFDGGGNDLQFSLAGSYSPLVMGNSVFHSSGTSLDSGATGFSSLDLGETHGCAVSSSVLRCWGDGTNGELGNGDLTTSADPVSTSTASTTGWTPLEVSVSRGSGDAGGFSCGLFEEDSTGDKRILCWGSGSLGQMGSYGNTGHSIPDSSNSVHWESGQGPVGSPSDSETLDSNPYDVTQISIDSYGNFGCALSREGHVKCWGYNNNGQLGHGNISTASDGPNEMGSNLAFAPLGSNRTASKVSVGDSHACALLDNGSVKCWGNNQYGRTGQGTSSGSIGDAEGEMGEDLATVDLGTGRTATDISAGSSHTCALLDDGSVKCWGNNANGRLGIGNTTSMGGGASETGDHLPAVDLGTGRTAIEISSGHAHSCAILDSGMLKCWGYNNNGQLGQGHNYQIGDGYEDSSDGDVIQCLPTQSQTDRECLARMGDGLPGIDLGEGRTAVAVSAGYAHTCAILDNGSVLCWGHNGQGRTGLGTTSGSTGDGEDEMGDNLATVDLGSGITALSISAGHSHSCALLSDQTVSCWGQNSVGQLGIGSNQDVDSPEEMGSGLQRADLPLTSQSMVAGYSYTCAILDDGTVRCWGENDDGRLGVYRIANENIGDSSDEMGNFLPITNLFMVPPDSDGDGWIDIWDSDDDNDGYTDPNDDLPFDDRDWFDHDGDGLGVHVDTDDDDPSITTADEDTTTTWSDEEEAACGTLWWSSLSEPNDYDEDGICDALDDDVDGNGWNDSYQCECSGMESSGAWANEPVFGSSGLGSYSNDNALNGYDFYISDHGIKLFAARGDDKAIYWLQRHDASSYGPQNLISDNNDFDWWGVQEQDGLVYLSYETQVRRMSDSNGSMSPTTVDTHGSTTSADTAISVEGDLFVRWHEDDQPTIRGSYLNGTSFYANAPGGLGTGGNNQHGQIAFGPDGRLHVLTVNISSEVVGFYHFYADLGSDLSGEVSLSWSAPSLVLERNQSTDWSSDDQFSATEDNTAYLHYSEDGKLYAAMYNQTDLWFATMDSGIWTTERIAESTGRNEGVTISTNSTNTPHVAWIDHSTGKLMLSAKGSGGWDEELVWQSDGWPESSGTQQLNYAKLTLKFDRMDDPFIMSVDANASSLDSALIHYKGSFRQPAYFFEPTDANSDGICDTLQYSVIDYGFSSLVLTKGEETTHTPEISGQALVEVWAPSLPEGISVNSTTGVISGVPTTVDTGGTTYTVYSNSTTTTYNVTITIFVRSPTPIQAGYGRIDDHQYLTTLQGQGYTNHAYDEHGNLYYYGRYYTNSAWSTDGITVSGLDSNDAYIAKRWSNGTWAWVVPLDAGSTIYPGEIVVDSEGNSYVNGHRDGGTVDLPGTSYDLPNREAAFVISVDTNGSLRWVNEAYMSSGSTSANWQVWSGSSINNYGFTRMHVDSETGNLTFAGQVSSNSLSDLALSFGNHTLDIPSSKYNYYRPFVTRINSTGEFSWVSSVTPGSSYHTTLQGMAVQDDGSVDVLMRGYGSTTIGGNSVSSDSYRFALGTLNSSGGWTGASAIESENPAGFDGNFDSAMMGRSPDGDLLLAIWMTNDATRLNVTGSEHFFNETCSGDSLVVMRLDDESSALEVSKEYCLTNNAAVNAEYSSQLRVDSQDRLWLFLGSSYTSVSNHHRIIRLDSSLNPDFEEFLSPGASFEIHWEDVAFDPLGNVFTSIYTNSCSMTWMGSTLGRSDYNCNYQSHFFMETARHTIDGATLVANEATTRLGVVGLSAMGATCGLGTSYCGENLDSWEIANLPAGLVLDSTTGLITGGASSNMSITNFTIWMNDTVLGSQQFNVSFSILHGQPIVVYDTTTFVLERGTEITPIVPTQINGSIVNWTFVPSLPEGLILGDSNGTIFGTPTANLTGTTFQLRISSEGATLGVEFNLTINEPLATIAYGNGSYVIPRDSIVSIQPTLGGGVVETFEINSTALPLGLSFNTTNGKFEGIPLLITDNSTYTVWANNSGGSASTEVSLWIVGNGITLSFPTSSIELVEGITMQPISGQTSGSTPESWEISPSLPTGMVFGTANGSIWGTPTQVLNQTNFTIWANASGGQTSSATISITVLADYDGDGIADIYDSDDDNDGWPDATEASCGTDPLDASSTPSDVDSDGLCDALDESDDRPIAMAYEVSNLDLIVNVSVVSLLPITSGGDVSSWETSPPMPEGLSLNNTTGEISGTPTVTFNSTNFIIWANNSAYTSSFNLTMSATLLDTDGDGEPDITDEDDDGDGWSDTNETNCSTDPLDGEDYPPDDDGDGICNLLDGRDDSPIFMAYSDSTVNMTTNVTNITMSPIILGGEVMTWEIHPNSPSGLFFSNDTGLLAGVSNTSFPPTNYTIWANNSQYSSSFVINMSSWRIDTDGDGTPDETDPDDDNDGWTDEEEQTCSTEQLDNTSIPTDSDEDGVCDFIDLIDDSPISLAYSTSSIQLIVNVTQVQLPTIVFGGDVRAWEIEPEIALGLTFNNNTGQIYGTATAPFGPTEFRIWANNSQYSSEFTINMSASLLDTDADGIPDETDPDDDGDGWGDENEETCLTDSLDPTSFPTDGDGDGECDGIDNIDDSPVFLVYSESSQLLFVDEPIDPIIATTYGGDVRTWEVWPPLPEGLALNGATARSSTANGTITGMPGSEFELQVFTVWANNSQYQSYVEITLQSVVPDPDDDDFDLIYLEDFLILTTYYDEVYLEPQIFGGNISSWSISPNLPEGLEFNLSNGLITGIPLVEVNETAYTVTGSNSLFMNTFQISIVANYLDTDEDGIPDLFDPDDDGDGWNDTLEIDCGTDSLDALITPDDHDGDFLCDLNDEFDDSPVVFFYPIDKLVLTVGEEMEPLDPLVAPTSGDILQFTVIPDLPAGLNLNSTTGVISGIPEEAYRHLLVEYSHTFTASNAQWSFSYRVDFDIFHPIDNNTDDDFDGWSDIKELECKTDPQNSSSFPEDIDLDGVCSYIDEDDDGDNIGDAIDRFPKDPTAWDDTDNDTMPDELTCTYLTDSANCSFTLVEDLDDDNDGWPDLNETSCGTDAKDNLSVPDDDDDDGVCNLLEEYVPDAVRILWICCFPLLLLLLMLLWLVNPFTVNDEDIMVPEPEYTSTENDWEGGTGEYDDPFVLKPVYGVRKGSFAQSHEVVKVRNITPRHKCNFTDMSAEDNGSRFSMRPIKSNTKGKIEFRLSFRDDGETPITTEYTGLIRLGSATVYFQWTVEVEVIKDTPEEERAKKRASRIEREAKKKAVEMEKEAADRAAEAEIEAKKKAAVREKEVKSRIEQIEKSADERAAVAELKAAEAEKRAAEMEKEASRRAAELEKESRREEADKLEREEKQAKLAAEEAAERAAVEAAERERKAEEEAAELRAMLRKKAEERKAEEEAEKAEEEAAKREAEEEAERIEREIEERSARLEREAREEASRIEKEFAREAAEKERQAQMIAMEAKEKLRKRAVERRREREKEEIDGEESRRRASERIAEMQKKLDERRSRLEDLDDEGRKKEITLIRISEKAKEIDFGVIGFALESERDNLQEIAGVGAFIEEKLNALGIFTFRQISCMNSELEGQINDAMEFFPGRVKRDEWVEKAKALIDKDSVSEGPGNDANPPEKNESELLREAQEEMKRKEEEEDREREMDRRREKAQELLKRKPTSTRRRRIDEAESVLDFGIIGFGSEDDMDNLQEIDGIGRFVEEKLNSIGIYKFSQIANMTPKIANKVNDAIGLGPGRIDRDEWVQQAKQKIR